MPRHWSAGLVVGVALLLSAGQSQDTCGGQDGRPGEAGVVGRNGWQGPKGEKGEPAPVHAGLSAVDPSVLLRLKGERGSRGFPGESGLKGLPGEVGPEGPPGLSGPPGPPAAGGRTARQAPSRAPQSAFSVVRTLRSYPEYDRPIIFQTEAVNRPGDMDVATGHFTCTVPGLYYFVFHAMSKVSMCLRLKSEALGHHDLGFCDYNTRRHAQVLSGGVVLQLTQNQRVWLEAFRDEQLASHKTDTQEKEIVFNGFLIS